MKILNKTGDITPPWRTPQETMATSDSAVPHLALTKSLLYQSRNTLIIQIGTPRRRRQLKSLLWLLVNTIKSYLYN